VLNNPDVDGVSIRQGWKNLEPTEGGYNWTYLDSQIASVKAAGKKVLLRINDGGGAAVPDWVMSGVTTTFTYFDTNTSHSSYNTYVTIPVFWDAYYLEKKKDMIAAVGAHFTGNSTVKIACVGIANANSADWNVPHTATDIINWQAVGYTSQKLIDSCDTIIDAMMAAFPNQVVVIAINRNGALDATPGYAASTVISNERAKWGDRLVVAKNGLAATTPPPPDSGKSWSDLYNARPAVAAQMLWFSYGDGTYRNNGGVAADAATVLTAAVDAGVSYGTKYQEIYEVDVINLPAVIKNAHTLLTQ
jgi:hypothetical protein